MAATGCKENNIRQQPVFSCTPRQVEYHLMLCYPGMVEQKGRGDLHFVSTMTRLQRFVVDVSNSADSSILQLFL
ncbi:hypothetical protein RRG08_044816 [Elysia crispata]|uniref:Uncharacterized protein n=1 Tax=Elysia crispata TaxID=231223 RepID=A0AAE1DNQ8_9GAST|nr:hypothetical protein RRG08_044816 [Elysia crispata]